MRKIVTLAATVVVLVAAQTAWAGDSTLLGGYGSNSAKAVIKVKSATATTQTTPAVTTAGTLPFTGADLGVVALAGAALVGLGFGLRRVGRDQNKN